MQLEQLAELWPEMPSGIAVTSSGRIFLSFPRWLDRRAFTVANLNDAGELEPFPDVETNTIDLLDPVHHLFCVQSVVASSYGTLWILDSGRPAYLPAIPGAAKLIEVDIETRAIVRAFVIPYGAARVRTYLNDVRFDFTRGPAGTAFISDSGTLLSRCAIIVVDLATGRKLRRLDGHHSVQPRLDAIPIIEDERLAYRLPFLKLGLPYQNGVDGIALDPSGRYVYYCPLNARALYRVDAGLLADPAVPDDDVARSVEYVGLKPMTDGLEFDEDGVLYGGDLEHRRVMFWDTNGPYAWKELVREPRFLWIDSMAATDKFLYFTVNQIERLAPFHGGFDKRKQPYRIFRTPLANALSGEREFSGTEASNS